MRDSCDVITAAIPQLSRQIGGVQMECVRCSALPADRFVEDNKHESYITANISSDYCGFRAHTADIICSGGTVMKYSHSHIRTEGSA